MMIVRRLNIFKISGIKTERFLKITLVFPFFVKIQLFFGIHELIKNNLLEGYVDLVIANIGCLIKAR